MFFNYLGLNLQQLLFPIIQVGGIGLSCGGIYYALKDVVNPKNKICKHSELSNIEGDGLLLSQNVRLSRFASNQHSLFVAPSAWGKSKHVVMHNVGELCKQRCNLIVSDPVKEIMDTVITTKPEFIFNPLDEKSIGYDPLKNCNSVSDVEKMCKVILMNGCEENSKSDLSQWIDMSLLLLTSFMIVIWTDNVASFTEAIEFITSRPIYPTKENEGATPKKRKKTISVMEVIYGSRIKVAIEKFNAFSMLCDAQQTMACVRGIMNTCLKCFLDEDVKRMCSSEHFCFEDFCSEDLPSDFILYVQIPETKCNLYKPLTTLFYSQLFDKITESHNKKQIYFIMDEFCNIGKFESIQNLLSTLRKYSCSIFALIQSLDQLEKTYPNEKLTDLFRTTVIGCGLKDSSYYFSDIIGDDENGDKLMSAQEIRTMGNDDLLIIHGNKRCVKDKRMRKYV